MKPASEVARGITKNYPNTLGAEGEPFVRQDIIDAIIQARREGAEEMRERAAHEADEDLWATRELSRIIRALSLVAESEASNG